MPGLDAWIAKLTPTGDCRVDSQLGGTGLDGLWDLEVLFDGRLAAAFTTESPVLPGLGPTDHRAFTSVGRRASVVSAPGRCLSAEKHRGDAEDRQESTPIPTRVFVRRLNQ